MAQIALLILGLGFAIAGLTAFTEPWSTMSGAIVAEAACAHVIAVCLAVLCFNAAFRFGTRAAYRGRRLRARHL